MIRIGLKNCTPACPCFSHMCTASLHACSQRWWDSKS